MDIIDIAQNYEDLRRQAALKAQAQRAALDSSTEPSRTRCEACDCTIPAARRKAIPGVRLCVDCKTRQEKKQV